MKEEDSLFWIGPVAVTAYWKIEIRKDFIICFILVQIVKNWVVALHHNERVMNLNDVVAVVILVASLTSKLEP